VNVGKKTKATVTQKNNTSRRAIRRLVAVIATLSAVIGLIWGLSRLGDEARRGIGGRDRYSVRFAEIECDPPLGFDRSTFLSEVRYCSNFPELFQSLDPDLAPKLTAAFTAHPWVASLDSFQVRSNGTVRVKLKYRIPVLAVRTEDGTRLVDHAAVLLPLGHTDYSALPELVTRVSAPTISAGQVWSDSTVQRSVELVENYHPLKLEKTMSGWRLTMPDGKSLVLDR